MEIFHLLSSNPHLVKSDFPDIPLPFVDTIKQFIIFGVDLFMETLRVDIQNEQEKRVLLAFLDSLDYNYRIDNETDAVLEQQAKDMASRKADFLAGKASSLPWSETKQ